MTLFYSLVAIVVIIIIGVFLTFFLTETLASNGLKLVLVAVVLVLAVIASSSVIKELKNAPNAPELLDIPTIPDELGTSVTLEQIQQELNRVQAMVTELIEKEKPKGSR